MQMPQYKMTSTFNHLLVKISRLLLLNYQHLILEVHSEPMVQTAVFIFASR